MASKTKTLISPLRYPGSKRSLFSFIKKTFEINKIHPSIFIEPFAGGASVALQMLQENLTDQIILVDVDPWITSFWQTVFFDTDWLVEQIYSIDVTIEKWHELKGSNPTSTRDQALTCFFLNRTSFSGILEASVGPIGGKEQKSIYKIDCRFMRDTLSNRIRQASLFKERVHAIWNCSWIEGIRKVRSEQENGKVPRSGLFFYLDPPFFEEAYALYRFYFTEKDHLELRDYLLTLKDNWLLSYDSAEQVNLLYGEAISTGMNGAKQHNIELHYSLAQLPKRKRGKEVIITNLKVLPKPGVLVDELQVTD